MLVQVIIALVVVLSTTAFAILLRSSFKTRQMSMIFVSFFVISVWRFVNNLVRRRKIKFNTLDISETITVEFIEEMLRKHFRNLPKIKQVKVESGALTGGMVGELRKIEVIYEGDCDGFPKSLIAKSPKETFQSFAANKLFGSVREALFYKNFVMENSITVTPKVYYSDGSLLTGSFLIIMEDLNERAILASRLLGNQCWGAVELPQDAEKDQFKILRVVFEEAADIHARFWRQKSLLQYKWLKNTDFLQNKGREKWEYSLVSMTQKWRNALDKVRADSTVKFSHVLVREMEAALSNSTWEKFQAAFDISKESTAFTLCHGDFHAANALWAGEKGSVPLYLVDWAEVGVFCPFTDLAQFLISNATIEVRRKYECELFKIYHARLLEKGVSGELFPLDKCWERYQAGGIERWLSMFTILAHFGVSGAHLQWFHDQTNAFIEDHGGKCQSLLYSSYAIL